MMRSNAATAVSSHIICQAGPSLLGAQLFKEALGFRTERRIRWDESERAGEVFDRAVEIALAPPRTSAIVPGLGELRIQAYGLRGVRDRAIEIGPCGFIGGMSRFRKTRRMVVPMRFSRVWISGAGLFGPTPPDIVSPWRLIFLLSLRAERISPRKTRNEGDRRKRGRWKTENREKRAGIAVQMHPTLP